MATPAATLTSRSIPPGPSAKRSARSNAQLQRNTLYPSTVCLFLLKIVSTLQDFRQAAARNFMRAISKRHQQTPGWPNVCAVRVQSSPARPISISWRTASLEKIAITATAFSPPIQPSSPEAHRVALPRPSRKVPRSPLSAPIQAAQSALPPRSVDSLATAPPWASATGPEAIISRPPSIPSAGYAAISATSHFSPSHFSTCSRKNRLPQSPASACSPARSSKPAIPQSCER